MLALRSFTLEDEPALAQRFLVLREAALGRHACATAQGEVGGAALSVRFLACFAAQEHEPVGGLILTLPEHEGARLPVESILESRGMLAPGERINRSTWRTGYVGALWLAPGIAGSGALRAVMDAGFELCCAAGMERMVGLCSPPMLTATLQYGFRVDLRFGCEGFFPYPDARYMTSVVYRDM